MHSTSYSLLRKCAKPAQLAFQNAGSRLLQLTPVIACVSAGSAEPVRPTHVHTPSTADPARLGSALGPVGALRALDRSGAAPQARRLGRGPRPILSKFGSGRSSARGSSPAGGHAQSSCAGLDSSLRAKSSTGQRRRAGRGRGVSTPAECARPTNPVHSASPPDRHRRANPRRIDRPGQGKRSVDRSRE